MALGEAKVNIRANLDPLKKGLKRAKDAVVSAVKGMVRTIKWGMVAIAGFLALTTKAAMKQEDAVFLLAAALQAAGDEAEKTMVQFRAFAAGIQKVTKYGDEDVLMLMQLMKSLGVASGSLEAATKKAIGLAAATGRDVQSMAMYIALAEQGEFTMLRRYIPALRSTTDATKQLQIITEFSARGFKIAEAQAKTTSGGLKQLWNVIGDIAELIGAPFLPLIKQASKALKEWLIENQDEFSRWGEVAAGAVRKVIGYILDLYNLITSEGWAAGMTKIEKDLIAAFEKAKPYALDLGRMIAAGFLEAIKASTPTLGGMIKRTPGAIMRGVETVSEEVFPGPFVRHYRSGDIP